MKKTKGCLWSTAVLFLSAIVPLYGDDDDNLDPAPHVKFEKVAQPAGGQGFARPKTFKEIQSEFRENLVNVRVPLIKAEEVFEEIKRLFRRQAVEDFRGLCQGLWDGVPFGRSPRAHVIYTTLASCLPRWRVVFSYLEAKSGTLKIRSDVRREARLVHFGFYYKNCRFICKILIYKNDLGELRLWRMDLENKEFELVWRLDEQLQV